MNNRLNSALQSINNALKQANRADNVALCAAAKGQSLDRVLALAQAGVQIFGENYVHEATTKYNSLQWQQIKKQLNLQLRLIGHLQSNKVGQALKLFDSIDSVDSPKLLEKLNRAAEGGPVINILLQYNALNEPSKSGVQGLDNLIALACKADSLPNINLQGIMAMAPITPTAIDSKKLAKQCFNKAYLAFKQLSGLGLKSNLTLLSMGMSGDYAEAIMEGATMVRLGTSLFGSRNITNDSTP
jgi:pyridoxal phosphate enzyme (YggS family)